MKTVWKFPIKFIPEQTISIPEDFEPVKVGMQEGEMVFWALVETSNKKVNLDIHMYATGEKIRQEYKWYLDTFQVEGYVWHFFA